LGKIISSGGDPKFQALKIINFYISQKLGFQFFWIVS
jgi:hypothetical protein